jgi:hypothetical protein
VAGGGVGRVPDVGAELDDYPVDLDSVVRDQGLGQWAVRTHWPQDWPTGWFCANCRYRWPCKSYRWGAAVLRAAGWSEVDIEACAKSDGPLPRVLPGCEGP